LSSGKVTMDFKKAPSFTGLPMAWNLEVPASGIPIDFFAAGAGRAA